MKEKRFLLRKGLLLLFLAAAGLVAGEIYQRVTMKTAEEVLRLHEAPLLMERTMRINDREVIAKVWELPEYISAEVLKKVKGRTLITRVEGRRIVYTFKEEVPEMGSVALPSMFPLLPGVTWEYVVDLTTTILVMGNASGSAEALTDEFSSVAKTSGWERVHPTYWTRGNEWLLFEARSQEGASRISMVWGRK